MIGPKEESLVPTRITVWDELKGITFEYPNGVLNKFSCEFLRVYSPSAEVVGHGPGQRKNPTGKKDVKVNRVDQVGNYAIQIIFSDGHDTGIYSWKYLLWLADNKEKLWDKYLNDVGCGR